MADQEVYLNEWNAILDSLPSEHRVMLAQTLPTPSLRLLLGTYVQEHNQRLQNISLGRSDDEFKQKYMVLKLQSDLAESLLNFVKTLTIKPT